MEKLLKSTTDSWIITRLFQILILLSFLSLITRYPEGHQIIKYISYLSFILLVFSLRLFIFDDLKNIDYHFNQFFLINLIYIFRIISDLRKLFVGLFPPYNLGEFALKYWIRFTHDYMLNIIVFTALLLFIFCYLILSIKKVKFSLLLFFKLFFLITFFITTIFLQYRVKYFFENLL